MVKCIDADFETYKAALARYAAKEKCLVEKWTKRVDSVTEAIESVETIPYLNDKYKDHLGFLKEKRDVYVEILADIKTPCDSFITDFEWSKVK